MAPCARPASRVPRAAAAAWIPRSFAACASAADGDACALPASATGSVATACAWSPAVERRRRRPGEACYDGNTDDGDACTSECALATCGDGVVQVGEACDAGAGNGDDRACTAACEVNVCGDGKLYLGVEACDDGNGNGDDRLCTSGCALARCGDGLRLDLGGGIGEACDDGNELGGDGCDATCAKIEVCGDAALDGGEACDDGNGNPADGCDACAATTWTATAVVGEARTVMNLRELPYGLAVGRDGRTYMSFAGVQRLDPGAAYLVPLTGAEEGGGALGDGGPAIAAGAMYASAVAEDGFGNLYVADRVNQRIRRIDRATGAISTVAGIGPRALLANTGDGGPATAAQLATVGGIAVDPAGNVVVSSGNRIRRVLASTGIIETYAGGGGNSGEGVPATSASLESNPASLAFDASGALYLTQLNGKVRRVDPVTRTIATVAGLGGPSYGGDGGPALTAGLGLTSALAVDGAGDVFVAASDRIRRIDHATGIISTVAGGGSIAVPADGTSAVEAALSTDVVAIGRTGAPLFIDRLGGRVHSLDADGGLTTIAAASPSLAHEGALATSRGFYRSALAVEADGSVYFTPNDPPLVLRRDDATGLVTTIAGNGQSTASGDGGPALAAGLDEVTAASRLGADGLLIAGGHLVRRIDLADETIDVFAGTGVAGFSGDGGPATSAQLSGPSGLAADAEGNVYIADTGNARIRRVDALSGTITTVAGGGAGDPGAGGLATAAQLGTPTGVTVTVDGDLLFADTSRFRVFRVDADTGVLATVAGTGVSGTAGLGGPATAAQLRGPTDVAVDAGGVVYIADSQGFLASRGVLRIDASSGVLTMFAPTTSFTGDGGVASAATYDGALRIAFDDVGRVYVASVPDGLGGYTSGKIRRFTPDGAGDWTVATIAGAIDPPGMGSIERATLAAAGALAPTAHGFAVVAGGNTGTVQAIDPEQGLVHVVAGRYPQASATGTLARFRDAGFGAVGGVAYEAATDRIYLTETTAHRVHVIDVVDPAVPATWTIGLLAGSTAGHADGALATATFDQPTGLELDAAARTLYVADTGNHAIRAISLDEGQVTTVAGRPGVTGSYGDGGAATDAALYQPRAVARCQGSGDLYIADTGNHRVRRVIEGSGVIETVLGDGVPSSAGQGAPAHDFGVDTPMQLACDEAGNVYVSSQRTLRLLLAEVPVGASSGVVDGSGAVVTILGAPPRDTFPGNMGTCLSGLALVEPRTLWATDACTGFAVEVTLAPAP
ncbi:MAG: hypothetical protein R2939_19825 [Kofleriaceae bacterium]